MRRSGRRRPQRGHVLIVALFVMVVVMTAAFLMAVSLRQRMELWRDEHRSIQLAALLDAGMAQALATLWSNPNWRGTGGEEPLGEGTLEIEVDKIGGLEVEVTVRATYGMGRRAARARVRIDRRPTPDPPEVLVWSPLPTDG